MDMNQGRGVDAGGNGGIWWRGIKERKKWDNCNSIINKMYLKGKETNKTKQKNLTLPLIPSSLFLSAAKFFEREI